MAQIIFYKGKGDIVDKGIRLKTGGIFSHCEILLSDGFMYSSSGMDGGVRRKKHHYNPLSWEYVEVDLDENQVREFYELTKNSKYDYPGIIGFFLPFKDRTDRWFCSEWCSNVYKIQGFKEMWKLEPSKIHPNKFHQILKGK